MAPNSLIEVLHQNLLGIDSVVRPLRRVALGIGRRSSLPQIKEVVSMSPVVAA